MAKRGRKKKMGIGQWWNSKDQKWEEYSGTTNYAAKAKEEVATKFKLIIPRHVMDKINWWMRKTNKEVSGFGSLDFIPETNTFVVKDAILLKQKVAAASAEIDPNAMAKAMFRMKDDPNGLKWHWHSHVNMGVFWSGDDMDIIRSLGQRSWILATVFNYANEKKTAYLTQVPLPNPAGEPKAHDIFVDNIDTEVINYVPKEQYEAWDKEYDEHVTEERYHYSGGSSAGNHGLTQYERRKLAEAEADKSKTASVTPLLPGTTGEPRIKWSSGNGCSYDDHGYADIENWVRDTIYNPCFDNQLKTDREKMDMIAEMAPDEIEVLIKLSPGFQGLLRQYNHRERAALENAKENETKESSKNGTVINDTGYADPYDHFAVD